MASAGDIDRHDHPALRGGGCWEKAQAGFVMGLFIGATIGGFYGGASAFKCQVAGREFARIVGRNMVNVGVSFAGFMFIGTCLRCF